MERMENLRQNSTIHNQLHQIQKFSSNSQIYFSTKMNIKNGIVQGAVLSVTLFFIAMTDICKGMKESTKIIG
jgi:hypothetical protein